MVLSIGRRSTVIGAVVSVASAALPMALGSGSTPSDVDLLDSGAWLVSESAGHVAHVNGETGRPDARVELAGMVGDLAVGQGDNSVIVSSGGEMRSIDIANLDWGASARADGDLVVGDDVAYTASGSGHVRQLDPTSLETVAETDLGAAPGRGVIAGGRLVVPLDDGSVAVVDGDEQVADVEVGGSTPTVTRVGDEVAVLGGREPAVRMLDPGSGESTDPAPVELPEGELLVPRELPDSWLWLTAPRSGELVGIDADSDEATTVSVPVADGGHDLSEPAVVDGDVYLVDRTAGEIVRAHGASAEVLHREPLELADASQVELVVEAGKLFVNDRAGKLAVVVDADGYQRVDKYSDEGVATETPPAETPNLDPPPVPGQAPPDPEQPQPPQPPPPPAAPPEPPVQVSAVAGNAMATVSWQRGGGAAPTAYHVARVGGPTVDVPAGQLSLPVDDLDNGTGYTFEVWASNGQGASERVRTDEVVPNDETPGTPSGVRATTEADARATVSWSAADGRGNDIASYIVTGAPGEIVTEVGGGETSVTVDGLTNGTAYTFTVTAVNDQGVQGEASAPSGAVTPYGPPTRPGRAEVAESGNTVDLSWGAASSTTPVEYEISARPAVGGTRTTADRSARFGNLTNGTSYTFTITAVNDRGAGPARTVTATPGAAPNIRDMQVERVRDRRFRVSFDIDNGGRPITTCRVAGGGGASCDGSGGSASVTIDVNRYNKQFTFTPTVGNSFGETEGPSRNATSAGKPLTVEADPERWDGALCWPESRLGQRPHYATPANNHCSGETGWFDDGDQARGMCHLTGEDISDDHENESNRWIRIGNGNYMSTLYFENYTNTQAVVEGLPACG